MARSLRPGLHLPIEGERVRVEGAAEGNATIVRRADRERVGTLTFEANGEELLVHALCIEEPYRSYGCGSEAGWMLVRAAGEAGFSIVRAHAPPYRGLAVYFWIRMGLRPLHGDGPGDGIWFERLLR